MDIRNRIRQIISEIFENEEMGSEMDAKKSKAKMALIALSNGQIPDQDIKYLYGDMSGFDFDDSGYTSSSGEVEIVWIFQGEEYVIFPEVDASFYLIKGSEGRWGSSIDDSEAPEPDDHSDEEVTISGDKIVVWDGDGEEYEFPYSELNGRVKKGLERMLLDSFDPLSEKIGSSK